MIEKIRTMFTNQKIYYILLVAYLGFMAIPQWFRPFSPQFYIWFLALPIIVLVLIVIGLRGVIGIWQTKASHAPPNVKHVFFTQLSGVSLAWFILAAGLAYGTHHLYNHQRFNSKTWQDPSSTRYVSHDLTPRQRMLDDLVENVLPGSTQSQIKALLGESPDTGYFSGSQHDLIYVLGAERGFGVDSEWLLIWFDDSGNFERYEITTD